MGKNKLLQSSFAKTDVIEVKYKWDRDKERTHISRDTCKN